MNTPALSVKAEEKWNPSQTFLAGYSQLPDAHFFKSFESQFEDFTAIDPRDTVSKQAALKATLGATEVELQRRREIDTQTAERFASLLAEAYRTGAMGAPGAFLQSLPKADLEVIQKAQCLVDPIDVDSLSLEGAYNLLLPAGYKVDFNRDGVSEIGRAQTVFFPPLDAPESFRTAWLRATEGMEEQDVMVYTLSLWGSVYSLNSANAHNPDPGSVRTDLLSTYSRLIRERLDSNEVFRAFLAKGQYERDQVFYNRLLDLIGPV